MKDTIEAFVESMQGVDTSQYVPAKVFMQNLLGCEVDNLFMRQAFNAFHSECPNFKVGEDVCPDCTAKYGYR